MEAVVMGKAIELKQERRRWHAASLEERADTAEEYGVDTLLYCNHSWALRHTWTNQQTGETQRARCNRWECLHCGPRKVDLWRQLVKIAEPTLFLTLTKAGKTVEQAARALTTFMQALRRGSKGRGKNHLGSRPAYPVEYFAVLERHSNFEENGFHWHILLIGVDAIPYKEVIQPLWSSATHGVAENGWIERIRNARAIGYVTKYLTKAISVGERGTRDVGRTQTVLKLDEDGGHHFEQQTVTETVVSKAHRVRYSRQFFPEKVAKLRERLFAGMEQETLEPGQEDAPVADQSIEQEGTQERSPWRLVEREQQESFDHEDYKRGRYVELVSELEEEYTQVSPKQKEALWAQVLYEVRSLRTQAYQQQKRKVLLEALEDLDGTRRLSRRVIHVWKYQRDQLRLAG
jgi:hypothetical protein